MVGSEWANFVGSHLYWSILMALWNFIKLLSLCFSFKTFSFDLKEHKISFKFDFNGQIINNNRFTDPRSDKTAGAVFSSKQILLHQNVNKQRLNHKYEKMFPKKSTLWFKFNTFNPINGIQDGKMDLFTFVTLELKCFSPFKWYTLIWWKTDK